MPCSSRRPARCPITRCGRPPSRAPINTTSMPGGAPAPTASRARPIRSTTPPARLRRAVADDALDLQEIVDGPVGVFAAVAGLLVAAERREGVPGRVVDLHLPGA